HIWFDCYAGMALKVLRVIHEQYEGILKSLLVLQKVSYTYLVTNTTQRSYRSNRRIQSNLGTWDHCQVVPLCCTIE
ncbi:hypothetical protein, partial [Pseudomonas aeruginosa]|uniref:hypothetical protein n=1 Tax=Pseudomonas aeruginosa TaxID=287 RepID=UPI0024BD7FDD